MKPKLIIVYVLIVVIPLALTAWLGISLARNEQEMVAMRFRELLIAKLNDVASGAVNLLEQRERELMAGPELTSLSIEELRERTRASGIVRQFFVLDRRGALIYPSHALELTEGEADFLEQTRTIWLNGEVPGPAAENAAGGKGWYAWRQGSGISLIFWWRDARGAVAGAELNEVRLAADIVGMLPSAWPKMPAEESPLPDGCIRMTDSNEAVVYQWGGYTPGEDEAPQARVALRPPLNSWGLNYYAPRDALASAYRGGTLFNVFSGLAVLALALAGLSVYFYRENTRALREAAQRVTFVNQVSHELKTPLTNIRMYAEMLDNELSEEDEDTRRRLDVIIAESQRLSRLIGNVLTFSQHQHGRPGLHQTAGNVDGAVRSVLARFEAPLRARGIQADFDAGASRDAEFDQDALTQILGNLLSNVEKYAPGSGRASVSSRQDGDTVTITVADRGPGIPAHLRERVFAPFYRLSSRLNDGAAGAGIGLTIARELARLHGGSLTLEPSAQGACFRIVLRAPVRGSGEGT